MRRTLLLGATVLLITSVAHATSLPLNACTGPRTISSQAQLNTFIAEGCTSLSADLKFVGSSDITTLSGLEALTHVTSLYIEDNAALTTLDGLGSIAVGGLYIKNNAALTSPAGLGSITHVGRQLIISGNATLASLDGLDAITHVGGYLDIITNPVLTGCACGLKGLATESAPGTFAFSKVSGTLTIENNGGASCNSPQAVLGAMPACPASTNAEQEALSGFALAAAAPSPTPDASTIRFSLDTASDVTLAVYDVLGREVARLVDGSMAAGPHEAKLEGANLPSGFYLYRLVADGRSLTGTLTVAR